MVFVNAIRMNGFVYVKVYANQLKNMNIKEGESNDIYKRDYT